MDAGSTILAVLGPRNLDHLARIRCYASSRPKVGGEIMPKGQEKAKTTNKPKLSVKEKKQKKKDKVATKSS